MLFYVLVPCLRLAPAEYCSAKVAQKMPELLAVMHQTADRPQVLFDTSVAFQCYALLISEHGTGIQLLCALTMTGLNSWRLVLQAQKSDAETGLMARTAAYRVLQALCQSLSKADSVKAVFAYHGGNPVSDRSSRSPLYPVCRAQSSVPALQT